MAVASEEDSVTDEYSTGTEPVAGKEMGNQKCMLVNDEKNCSVKMFSGKKKPSKKKNKSSGAQEENVGVESKDKKVPKHVRQILEKLAKLKEAEEKKKREEEEKQRKEEEERLKQEETERIAEERRRLKKEREKEKALKKKREGKLLTAKQKEEAQRLELMRNQFLQNAGALLQTIRESPAKRPVYITKKSKPLQHIDQEDNVSNEEKESDDDWEAKSWNSADLNILRASAEEEEGTVPASVVIEENKSTYGVNGEEGEKTILRSPICCVMGHVDAGKTKLLDCIRRTKVQEGEAGGITQQIGATYIPADNILERAKELKADAHLDVPGLVVIDTPGHEAFKNLRSRGSGLCDIAILVVDLMHGLQQQTIESIKLLRMRNTPFIVALNKVDRLYGWKTCLNLPIGKAVMQQSKDVRCEFDRRVAQIITEFMEQGLNTELYYNNKDWGETYNLVPTSAISGEGVPEMLLLVTKWAQKTMVKELTYNSEVQCKVLDVKVIKGRGTTIDVLLYNGVLHVGDEIVVCGFKGPIHTTIRSLLTPHQMKGAYIHHKEIKAAHAIKITAQSLDHAVPGTTLYVVGPHDVEEIKESVMDEAVCRLDKSGEGVYVQASTLGSLEALLTSLKAPTLNIPVSGIGIGPVHQKDVRKVSAMLEKNKEFATILAFDVKVTPEASELADGVGVKIFVSDVMHHLFSQFQAYNDKIKEAKKKEAAENVVFPCVLKILPTCVFNKKDPIFLGVHVKEGILKIGTPVCIPTRNFIDIGRIFSIEDIHKRLDYAKRGQVVAIQIRGSNAEEQQKMFGRHFDMEDEIVSHFSRKSVDALEGYYQDELSIEDWQLVMELKHLFKIQRG